ncbi:MAG: RES family NAD+ phosphorylase [Ottowia sp.]|nr:RES family NAD+ phosphorylase [Ottowia sp.]
MRLWRLTAHPGLDGFGGTLVSGRWHNRPRRVAYAAEHPALAVLESLAHLNLSLADVPTTLRLLCITVTPGAIKQALDKTALPDGWQANEVTCRAMGSQWLDGGSALLLGVPSALVPRATNYLINPAHPQAATHLAEADEPFWFDQRLLR